MNHYWQSSPHGQLGIVLHIVQTGHQTVLQADLQTVLQAALQTVLLIVSKLSSNSTSTTMNQS